MVAVGCLAILLAASLFVMDRKDRRAHEERQANRLERANLLQRIQAPREAVIAHQIPKDAPTPEAVDLNSDDAYWEARA